LGLISRLAAGLVGVALLAGCSNENNAVTTNPGVSVLPPSTSQSPVPSSFLVVSQGGQLLRLDADGKNAFHLAPSLTAQDPTVHPDGTAIAFSRRDEGTAHIYRINPDGTGLIDLLPGFPYSAVTPQYSWDGSKIAFAAEVGFGDRDLYLMNADGSGLQRITQSADIDQRPGFSVDGDRVAFQRGSAIAEVPSGGGTVSHLTDGESNDTWPSFIPSTGATLFTRDGDLYAVRGTTLQQITNTPHDEIQAHATDDGSQIYALSRDADDPPGTGDIVVMNSDGTNRRELSNNLRASGLAIGALKSQGSVGDGRLNIKINNQSGHQVFVKFIGSPLVVDKNNFSIASGGTDSTKLTEVSAGRILVSYDKALSSNEPDGANPGDADYQTRFDKVELSFKPGAGGKANLTAVDFYSIPMVLDTEIEGTTIDHLTLANGKTGKDVEAALSGVILDRTQAVIEGGGVIKRFLAPVKAPGAYLNFDSFLDTLNGSTLKIVGTFFGTPTADYNYTGTWGANDITLSGSGNTIRITRDSLKWDKTDLKNHNGIYTCNGAYTVNGATSNVTANDINAAVYRDLVAGLNFGYVKPGANDSTNWANEPRFSGSTYNQYAKAINDVYPGAYGFPFTDRYDHILADLGNRVDTMTITLLADTATAPPPSQSGTLNPQDGSVKFNLILVDPDNKALKNAPLLFNTKTFSWQSNYNWPSNVISPATNGMQINQVPAREGLNIYTLTVGNKTMKVLLKVQGGSVSFGTIAGGGNANFASPNLFVGGL